MLASEGLGPNCFIARQPTVTTEAKGGDVVVAVRLTATGAFKDGALVGGRFGGGRFGGGKLGGNGAFGLKVGKICEMKLQSWTFSPEQSPWMNRPTPKMSSGVFAAPRVN